MPSYFSSKTHSGAEGGRCRRRQGPARQDRARFRSSHLEGGRIPVLPLHEKPLPASGADEDPPTLQLLAVQREDDAALAKRLVEGLIAIELVGPDVPYHDRAAAVLAFRDHTLESRVVERWSSTAIARRLTFGSSDGPFGTAHDTRTPPASRRKS